jgi:serine/threonine protein kinase/Tol biopolymer transport system component
MSLAARDKLGPYEILAPIGKGGMGEVYRARDSRLNRDVAVKVLPAALERDPERLARFQREAQILAGMNHPNIAMLFGLEDSGGGRALVLELVEGPTLADRIQQGAIPPDEAALIALQIAQAFEYAHGRGVVHRDLKPANVKITPEDRVKVLDFGLAKALSAEPERSSDPNNSPTMTMGMTTAGAIMGTAGYMSPEQAKGKSADHRTDIWAFGVVLSEMLTGKPLYAGETAGDTIASIIKDEPPLERLPAATPPGIRYLIERCLHKDPQQRLQHMGEARIILEHPERHGPLPQGSVQLKPEAARSRLALVSLSVLAGAMALAAGTLGFVHFREPARPESKLRFQIPAPGKSAIGVFRISPDGRYLVFMAGSKLWLRPLDSLESKALEGTDGASYPFWSPDSESIGFFAQGKLKRLPRSGGLVQTLCEAAAARGGTWNRDGVIVFSPGPNLPLYRVMAAGGTPSPLGQVRTGFGGYRFPEFLPDGQHFLYLAQADKVEDGGIYVGALDGKAVRLFPNFSNAIFAANPTGAGKGHLLFRQSGTLMALPFDPDQLKPAGDAVPVAERIGIAAFSNTGFGAFSVASDGTLVLGSGEAGNQQVVWVDRQGKRLSVITEASLDTSAAGVPLALSPDGHTLAFVTGSTEESTIWLQTLPGGTPTRFTFATGRNANPIWSSDGSRVLYAHQNQSGYLTTSFVKQSNGAGQEEVLLPERILGGVNQIPDDWSRDGKWVVFRNDAPSPDLWMFPVGGDNKPVPFVRGPSAETDARFSPDGKFVVYQSDESGLFQVYVQPMPPNGSKWQVSKSGGQVPRWKGSEIFYIGPDQKLMAAPVKTDPTFVSGTPEPLFETSGAYAPAADGKHFVVAMPATGDSAQPPPLTVITHWQTGLKK